MADRPARPYYVGAITTERRNAFLEPGSDNVNTVVTVEPDPWDAFASFEVRIPQLEVDAETLHASIHAEGLRQGLWDRQGLLRAGAPTDPAR